MKKRKSRNGLSLKIKILILFIVLSVSMLTIYASLVLKDFENDKIAYIFDSNKSHSQSTANLVHSEIVFSSSSLGEVTKQYDLAANVFLPETTKLLADNNKLKAVWSYAWSTSSRRYVSTTPVSESTLNNETLGRLERLSLGMLQQALEIGFALRAIPENTEQWVYSRKFRTEDAHPVVIFGLFTKASFLSTFFLPTQSDTLLVTNQAEIIFSPASPSSQLEGTQMAEAIEFTLDQIKSSLGTIEFNLTDKGAYLISLAKVGNSNLNVVSIVSKSTALQAIKLILAKSTLFLILFICISVFVSVIFSSRLTRSLKILSIAVRKVSKGKFDTEVKVQSTDEIGGLARGFNHMTKEIKRLMLETKEKARMEAELQTAQVVQSTLFPKSDFENGRIAIKGFYEPASECGGDWWYYNVTPTKTLFWIGDATGHGVPAALVTSAARSASGILAKLGNLDLAQLMVFLNQAIRATAGGQVLMTFFLGCFDHRTRKFSYTNASHDPPLLFPFKSEGIKKSDLVPLMENNGPRLGESDTSKYEISTLKLRQGDRIVFYTDGVTELVNSEGKMWGEPKFIRSLLKQFNKESDIGSAMTQLNSEIKEFRGEQPLDDDITYFMFQYKNVS